MIQITRKRREVATPDRSDPMLTHLRWHRVTTIRVGRLTIEWAGKRDTPWKR
jgi:hypothetical protein